MLLITFIQLTVFMNEQKSMHLKIIFLQHLFSSSTCKALITILNLILMFNLARWQQTQKTSFLNLIFKQDFGLSLRCKADEGAEGT